MNVSRNKTIEADLSADFQSVEDPRLFIHRGQPWVCFICSSWPQNAPTCVVRYGRVVQVDNGWRIEDVFQPKYGANDGYGLEKNWVPFEAGESLFFIYKNSPEQIVLQVEGNYVIKEHVSKSARWAFGELRGGTTPLPYKGKLLRFFHSSLDFELPPSQRRYFMGAAIMEPEPPFATIAVSKEPICWGSELDDLSETERIGCLAYKKKVVFPAGAIIHDDGFVVSAGVNDCEIVLMNLKEKDLKLP